MAKYRWLLPALMTTTSILMLVPVLVSAAAEDENNVYSPCEDTKVKKSDGFSFGIAFASTAESFSRNQVELSPCDSQLGLAYTAKVVVFRPYVDEISLLTVNTSSFQVINGMYMVAFAGRKYAARSLPTFVSNYTYIVTSFTLVLEFQKGTLQNLYWNKDGCSACSRSVDYSCLNDQECALQTSKCSQPEKTHDCNLSIQLAFSGTDKNNRVLNSWYEVSKLRQYSLYDLFSGIKNSIFNP